MIGAVIGTVVFFKYYRLECLGYKTIDDIGYCDQQGLCSVRYSDGTTGNEHRPVYGGTVCSEWRVYDREE